MRPTSGMVSARNDIGSRGRSRGLKVKKVLPLLSSLKNIKTYTILPSYPPWQGDESQSFKVSAKPVFEDSAYMQILQEKYPKFQRIQQVFGPEATIEDADVKFSIANPEVDDKFSSALNLCLSKGISFFKHGCFEIYPKEANPSGKYCVKMYENGQPVRLVFDDRIPLLELDVENLEEGEEKPLIIGLIRDKNEKIMLPTLLHKAFLRFNRYESYKTCEIVTAFTGYPHYEVPLEWSNILYWFGRPDSLVALYIQNKRNDDLGEDRLFHILDVVEVDQNRKFVKLKCPGAKWKGKFSGYEEDTRHWTNQIRILLEIDPETAISADFFWMILEDVLENFDSIVVFQSVENYRTNIKKQDMWNPKEQQFYYPQEPFLMKATAGTARIYCAPVQTSSSDTDLVVKFRHFNWNTNNEPTLLDIRTNRWQSYSLNIENGAEIFEVDVRSKGGYYMQVVSADSNIEFIEYSDIINLTLAEGDLPFFVSMEDYVFNVFAQRFEPIGKVLFNLYKPGNISYTVTISNPNHSKYIACFICNLDTNDIVSSTELGSGSILITPNNRGYSLFIYGLYPEVINSFGPADLIGKWRARIYSDVTLSDVVDIRPTVYNEVEGEILYLDETHLIQRHVITGGCEATIIFETSQPLSLTLILQEDENIINEVRGVGFCVLPSVKVPGDKDSKRVIIRSICSEKPQNGFNWKIRIYSTSPVVCKEDTQPAERIAAIIASWEKKRNVKPVGKKGESKVKSSETGQSSPAAVLHENVLNIVQGEATVLTEEQINAILPGSSTDLLQENNIDSGSTDLGEDFREGINALISKINDNFDNIEGGRTQISKLYTPPPPKVE